MKEILKDYLKNKGKKLAVKVVLTLIPVIIVAVLVLNVVAGAHTIYDKIVGFFTGGEKTTEEKTLEDFESEEEFMLYLLDSKDSEGEDFLSDDFFSDAHMTRDDYKTILDAIIEQNKMEAVSQNVNFEYTCQYRDKELSAESSTSEDSNKDEEDKGDATTVSYLPGNTLALGKECNNLPVVMAALGSAPASSESSTDDGGAQNNTSGTGTEAGSSPEASTAPAAGSTPKATYVWGAWKTGTQTSTVLLESLSLEGKYKVYWQDVFAVYQMVAKENLSMWKVVRNWVDGVLLSKKTTSFMSESELKSVIDSMKYTITYYYDGARGSSSLKESDMETVAYYYTDPANLNKSDKHEQKGDPVKVPITVPYSISNSFDRIVAETDVNGKLTGYQRTIDKNLLTQHMELLMDEFQLDLFLELVSILPNSEDRVEYYKDLLDAENEQTVQNLTIAEVLGYEPPGDIYIGTDVVIVDSNGMAVGSAGYLTYDYLNANGNYDLTLAAKDPITEEQMISLVKTVCADAGHPDSLLADTGAAFYRAQEEQGISAIGAFAIACHESGYGTSRIAREKCNFFGWGANDENPYGLAKNFSQAYIGVYTVVTKIAKNYTYGQYNQDTYYKMRYNNGTHQYCTDPDWPTKCASMRARIMKRAAELGYIDDSLVADSGYSTEIANPGITKENIEAMCMAARTIAADDSHWYVLGAAGPKDYDCSGLVMALYRDYLGISLPHKAAYMASYGKEISMAQLQPGDIMLCGSSRSNITHVVMYVGNGEYVGAESSKSGILVKNVNARSNYVMFRTLIYNTK